MCFKKRGRKKCLSFFTLGKKWHQKQGLLIFGCCSEKQRCGGRHHYLPGECRECHSRLLDACLQTTIVQRPNNHFRFSACMSGFIFQHFFGSFHYTFPHICFSSFGFLKEIAPTSQFSQQKFAQCSFFVNIRDVWLNLVKFGYRTLVHKNKACSVNALCI